MQLQQCNTTNSWRTYKVAESKGGVVGSMYPLESLTPKVRLLVEREILTMFELTTKFKIAKVVPRPGAEHVILAQQDHGTVLAEDPLNGR